MKKNSLPNDNDIARPLTELMAKAGNPTPVRSGSVRPSFDVGAARISASDQSPGARLNAFYNARRAEQGLPKPVGRPDRLARMVRPTGMKKGGKVSSASKRADGCAIKGKTKGRML